MCTLGAHVLLRWYGRSTDTVASFQFAIIIVIIVIAITKVQVVYTNDQVVPNRVSPSPLPALVDSGYLLPPTSRHLFRVRHTFERLSLQARRERQPRHRPSHCSHAPLTSRYSNTQTPTAPNTHRDTDTHTPTHIHPILTAPVGGSCY